MDPAESDAIKQQTFWEHVGELRTYALIGGVLFVLCAFALFGRGTEYIAHELFRPLDGRELVFLSPMGPFLFEMRLAFLGAAALSLPLWLYLCARFVGDSLPRKKRIRFFGFVLTAAMLGFGALAASIFLLVPVTYEALISFAVPGTTTMFTADSYIDLVLLITIATFIVFELPVIIVALSYLRLVSPHFLASHRRYIYIGLLIALAIITPTGDPITLLIVTIPSIALVEIGIALGKWVYNAEHSR